MSSINPKNIEKNSTTNAFLSSLAVNVTLLLIEIGAFVLLKQKLWRIYAPRVVLPPPSKRSTGLPPGVWGWFPALIKSPAEDILHKNGLDAYMFIRFIKLLIIIFSVFTAATFLIIVPANALRVASDKKGLERIAWTNITSPANQNRFGAHVATVYLLTGFVVYMIRLEMLHFLHMRHQFLISKSHSRLAQARTVLITPVPQELSNERDIRTFASFVPGGIDKIWMYRDTGDLNKLFERRQECCKMLETAEVSILKCAALAWRKQHKQHKKSNQRKLRDTENSNSMAEPELPSANKRLLDDLVPAKIRPTHRTGFLGLFGLKVDTINWCKDQISLLNIDIKESREKIAQGKFLGSPLWMYNKWMEVNPKDIIWRNLDDGAMEMKSRYAFSWVATVGLIIAWAFPVSFIGSLSNLSSLCEKVHWLQWVCEAPPVARGLLEGVLPPVLLAVLFTILPYILRALAWYECIPRWSMISVSVYRRYYFFLLIHGFLIVTLTSGITNVTQGLAGAGTAILQLVPLAAFYLRKWILGRTPRQAYDVTFKMPAADFGVLLPRISLLATIAFAYSVLSPLINLLALISYMMFYLAWKFLFMQVFDQPDDQETGGMFFPMAINNLFVGLYIEQICLTCLFFLNVSAAGTPALVEACFMIVLIILTACAQLLLHSGFHPLKRYLPMSLATNKMARRYSKDKNRRGETNIEEEEIDLFSKDRIRSVRKRINASAKRLDEKLDAIKDKVIGDDKADVLPQDVHRNRVRSDDALTTESQKTDGFDALVGGPSQHSSSKKLSIESKEESKITSFPVFDPAAPAVEDSDSSSDEEEDDGDHAFNHPSTYADQPWIWLPKDSLGLSELLVSELKEAGVDASNVGASMDEEGVVEVSRNPPDEEWSGGHDL
ncbi:hypothetical protein HYPSUDRAFT_62761 [Hypholoma sublateritium FD-334 SS-4]|uniref:CSC1/OSCA1-like 7TM region domain-containing protein n=1 Tax=Hypholoma sublateritium (strain FD-334 SS-4) TaxID=945553 RepID=A0A0D2PGU6_HYPSF|nr:hypothetical protein HYPSUDRAFT_62761 [Hypholoma sublateritium FD-334 SS-4]